MTHYSTRLLAFAGVLALFLGGIAERATAEGAKLRPLAPPEDALHRTPGPDGRVSMRLDLGEQTSYEPVFVKMRPFWGKGDTPFEFKLVGPGAAADGKSAEIQVDQPLVLIAAGIPEGQVVWGVLTAKQGATLHLLPLVLGSFGPTVDDGKPVAVPTSGRARLPVDMSQHKEFGDSVRFEMTPFTSGGYSTSLLFLDPAQEGQPAKTVEVDLSSVQDTIWLEIDANSLRPDAEYTGALQTTIGERRFIDTALVLKRDKWSATGAFAPIQPVSGVPPIALTIRAASPDQPLEGLFVSSASPAKDGVDPRTDLAVTLDGISLWTVNATKRNETQRRSIEPNGQREILVGPAPTRDLPAGTHEVTLLIGALNVAPEKWEEAKVTLVVRHFWGGAVAVLVGAVLLSYAMTKGLVTAVRRRKLRLRIRKIQKASWLRNDRWGALPIVRAFGRIALADRVLAHKHGFTLRALARFVTTPQLIADEVTEVETRLEVLKRLNKLAIYWHAAPLASGVSVSGVDSMIVNRARKILRRIVDRFSQLQEGEEIGPLIMSEIEALEGWEQRNLLEAGYWAYLRGDIQLLLDGVQLERFDFDDQARLRLEVLLKNSLAATYDDKVKQKLKAALGACEVAENKGVGAVRAALAGELAPYANADKIKNELRNIEVCERETVRSLQQALDPESTPGTLNKMIRMEGTYTRLKLVWEQRNDRQRRTKLIEDVNIGKPLDKILGEFDDEVWELLKVNGAVRIVPPNQHGNVESYAPTDFKIECTNPNANTFLFKHGLEYKWTFKWRDGKKLTAITRSTTVTQFIPVKAEVKLSVIVRRGNQDFTVEGPEFTTVETSRFEHLWPTGTPELIGIGIALILALFAGFQTDAFTQALEGSWREYLALFGWGIAADQTKNLLQNLDSITKGEGAVKT